LHIGVTFGPVDLNNDGDFTDAGEVNPVTYPNGITFANNVLIFTPQGMPVTRIGALGGGTAGLRAVDSAGNIVRQHSLTVSNVGRIKIN
jgi:hypothetical protein